MRSQTLVVALLLSLASVLGPGLASANQLVTATLKNGNYGTGSAIAPTNGVVNTADGVLFIANQPSGRSNALVNWQIGNNNQWRRTGTITFLFKAIRGQLSSGGGTLINDNYGFNQFNNGQSTFGIGCGPVPHGPGPEDDRVSISWSTWHNSVWYTHNTIEVEYDKWISIGFVWGRPGTQFEVWVNQQLVSAQNVPGVSFPWGSDFLGLGSGFNMGLGDNHERGFSGYESAAGVMFADIRMWNEVRPLGDTVHINSAPTTTTDSYSVNEDGVLTVPAPGVLANDSDPDNDGLAASLNVSAAHGALALAPDGSFTYTPNAGFNGDDSFSYMTSDGSLSAGPTTVSITVTPVNDAPVANPDSASTAEDTAVTVDVIANDTDVEHDTLTLTQAAASSGSVSLDGNQITFTPDPDFHGGVNVSYTISDGHGGTAHGDLTITVTPVNDAPSAAADSATTAEDTPVTIDVLANDSDVDGDPLTITSATASSGSVAIGAGGLSFSPAANFNGSVSIDYSIEDGHGGSATGSVAVLVTPVNDGPVAQDDSSSTPEDTSVLIVVLANDSDADGDALTITGATASNGSVSIGAGGLTFTPAANFNGAAGISYTIADGNGGSASASVSITVTAGNDAPTTNDAAAATVGTTPVGFTLTGADVDGDALTFVVSAPAHGSLGGSSPSFVYTADAGFSGTETLAFVAADGNGSEATGTVTITVQAPPPPPPPPPPPSSLEDMIQAMRGLNDGQRNSLLVRLRNAERKEADGQYSVAQHMFEQLADSVEHFGGPDAETIAAAIRARIAAPPYS